MKKKYLAITACNKREIVKTNPIEWYQDFVFETIDIAERKYTKVGSVVVPYGSIEWIEELEIEDQTNEEEF